MDDYFLARLDTWFAQLLPQVTDLQFTNGGPIIAVQVGTSKILLLL